MPHFKSDLLFVTGFGPFAQYSINPSWEAVESIQEHNLPSQDTFDLEKQKLSVSYSVVSNSLRDFWHSNLLNNRRLIVVVHFGVEAPGGFKVETCARNFGYSKPDVDGFNLPHSHVFPDGADQYQLSNPRFDCKDLVQRMVDRGWLSCQLSSDAGQYLCEFSYYNSLYWSSKLYQLQNPVVLFCHVPPVGCPYSQLEINRFVLEFLSELVILCSN